MSKKQTKASSKTLKTKTASKSIATETEKVGRALKIASTALGRFKHRRKEELVKNPFQLPLYAPGVLPHGARTLQQLYDRDKTAFDAAPTVTYNWDPSTSIHGTWAEGIGFMGYPYLADLIQRTEYRRPCAILAEEMTRKWLRLKADGDEDKSEKIQELTSDLRKYNVKELFRRGVEVDAQLGMAFLYIDVGTTRDDNELLTPLHLRSEKIKKGSLKAFRLVEPTWMAPDDYNTTDPLDEDYYRPRKWFVMGRRIHSSRLVKFCARPVPDILKPAYNFGGVSLTQMLKPYVDNWLKTRQGVSDLVMAFTIFNLATNLSGILANGSGDDEDKRLQMFADMRSNYDLLVTDKTQEEFKNISAPLGSLDHLQAQSQEHQASVEGIPLVKLFGITPSGLNTSADPEIRVFYDHIGAMQSRDCDDQFRMVLDILQLNRYGKIDPTITHEWVSLWELDEAGQAAVQKTKADTDAVNISSGIIDPFEARKRIASDAKSPYEGLVPENVPEPPDPLGMEDDFGGDPAESIASAGAKGSTKGPNAIDESPGATSDEVEMLVSLFIKGPMWDGDVPSKHGRDLLVDKGLATHRHGHAFLTTAGVDLCVQLGLGEYKELRGSSANVSGAFAYLHKKAKSIASDTDLDDYWKWFILQRLSADNEWHEEDHPRGQPDNAGQFVAGGSSSKRPSRTAGFHQLTKNAAGKLVYSGGKLPEHIAKLRIPPAWTDVVFNPNPNGHLLVVGKDKKGRAQALYSQKHASDQAHAKFQRVKQLDAEFDKVYKQNEANRKSTDVKKRALADATALIMSTGIRPGSDTDTKGDEKAYGATTLLGSHVIQPEKGKVELHFTGKKGVKLKIPVTDPGLAKMLLDRKKAAGEKGMLFEVNQRDLLEYVHSLDGGHFKTKDFRTCLGTRTAMDLVSKTPAPQSVAEYKRAVLLVAKAVADKLGNTPTVALQSYINPAVFAEWKSKFDE